MVEKRRKRKKTNTNIIYSYFFQLFDDFLVCFLCFLQHKWALTTKCFCDIKHVSAKFFYQGFHTLKGTHGSKTKDFPIHIIVMSRILLINSIFSLITMFYKYIVPNLVIFRFYFAQKKNKFQNKKLQRIRRIFFFLSIVLKIIFFPEIKIQKEYSLFDICRIKKIE